jgi:hypothetical protein
VPKLIMISNMVLLLALSIMMGAALSAVLGEGTIPDHRLIGAVSCAAWASGGIMLVTEIFSGIRLLPVITFACLSIGALADGPRVTVVTTVAWTVGWLSTAGWFAILAHRARENR